jgi:hypothetical protein
LLSLFRMKRMVNIGHLEPHDKVKLDTTVVEGLELMFRGMHYSCGYWFTGINSTIGEFFLEPDDIERIERLENV